MQLELKDSNESLQQTELINDGRKDIKFLQPDISYTVKLGVRENPTYVNSIQWKWSVEFKTKCKYQI